jgi:hypothetical protein
MKYRDCANAREYLERVLTHWVEWERHNGGLHKAIRDILEENMRLKVKLYELEHETNK